MARPRVFISSTFYDLRQVRTDLERFIREVGYEPVQHERGQVPYGSAEKLEQYCYKEIGQVDIVVNIIGGRFGSTSFEHDNSISQMELKTAQRLNKQCYVFVDAMVMAEYQMYLRNRSVAGITYVAADDDRIFKFIEEIEALPRNNQIIEFRQAEEIAGHLREQWAGLFQRFLQQQESLPERRAADDLHTALTTVRDLVTFLTNEKRQQGSALNEILLSNHPVFEHLRKVTDTPYPLFFRTREDMLAWLRARSWVAVSEEHWDDRQVAEWTRSNGDKRSLLKISSVLFDEEGKLRVLTSAEWNDAWVTVSNLQPARRRAVPAFPATFESGVVDDDDVPF